MAITDSVTDPWFAPAGLNRGVIPEAVGIERSLSQGERDLLYSNGINPIANFVKGGIVVWGQKTLQSLPTALDRVNVRRLLLFIRKSIATAVLGLIFEPYDPKTWRRLVNLINPLLADIKGREGLVDYKVVCDSSVNTPSTLDNSELHANVFLKPVKAAEFIIVDYILTSQGSTFNETVTTTGQ